MDIQEKLRRVLVAEPIMEDASVQTCVVTRESVYQAHDEIVALRAGLALAHRELTATFNDVLKVAEIIAVETRCRYARADVGESAALARKCIALKATPTQDTCFCRDAATAVMRYLNLRLAHPTRSPP